MDLYFLMFEFPWIFAMFICLIVVIRSFIVKEYVTTIIFIVIILVCLYKLMK